MIEDIAITRIDLNSIEHALTNALTRLHCESGFCILDGSSWQLGADNQNSRPCCVVLKDPVASIFATAGYSAVRGSQKKIYEQKDVWGALETWLSPRLLLPASSSVRGVPLCAGYLGYELLHFIEDVPYAAKDLCSIPLYLFYLYGTVACIYSGPEPYAEIYRISYRDLTRNNYSSLPLEDIFLAPQNTNSLPASEQTLTEIQSMLEPYSNFSCKSYCASISHIQELLFKGEVYQVNLSQQFRIPYHRSPAEFFLRLRRASRSNYSMFLHCSGEFSRFSIASASPELFLRSQNRHVLCSPIKGTRPRGTNAAQDLALCEELLHSEKDRAELSMIVDLVRNDLGRVAETGSVNVESHARLESLPHVHHLVSDIRATLPAEVSVAQLIRATFPCGSVTGAPKVAAMRVISDLERTPREVYTGALGCFGAGGDLVFNVAIRTATLADGLITFNAGGGIVVDSNPLNEYQETLVKARGIASAL